MIYGRRKCECGHKYISTLHHCPKCNAPEWNSDFLPFNGLDWVYDIETYPNIFTADFMHPKTGTRLLFEVSDRKNQVVELYEFLLALEATGCRMVGFNNVGFDYPVIHNIIENIYFATVETIYDKASRIIHTSWERRFDNLVWDSEVHIQQIDLYKIHHFDNENKKTSLKEIEFNLQMDSIEDLPYPPGTKLSNKQKPVLIKYNDHDVDATMLFYVKTIDMIEFREQLSEKYNRNFINHNDTKIGKDYFIMKLEEHLPGICYSYDTGSKKPRQTVRPHIDIGEVIFPYIKFQRSEFKMVKTWLSNFRIHKTKGVFEYITVTPEMAMSMRHELIKVYKLSHEDVPSIPTNKNLINGILLKDCFNDLKHRNDLDRFEFISGWKDKSGLNCIIDNFAFDFGTGGIHGSVDSCIIQSDDNGIIIDVDVASYYPNLAIVNKLYPEHLSGQFCNIYNEIYDMRKLYPKGTPENAMLKLALNGVYGDSNSKYSPFYDSKFTMAITINGQLLLCLLAENLMKIPGLQMIQINTDGLTVKCPHDHRSSMDLICKWWESFTLLQLESNEYSRMFIRDVNNYIAEYMKDGKLKRKGAYCYGDDLKWEQNYSEQIVARAAEAALVKGTNIEQFVHNHSDDHDFMLRSKVNRTDHLMYGDTRVQRITRYYMAIAGSPLIKVAPPKAGCHIGQWKRKNGLSDYEYTTILNELGDMTGSTLWAPEDLDILGKPWDERINTKNRSKYENRETSFHDGYLVATCNDMSEFNRSNVNYQYYIDATKKLVEPLL